MKIYDMGGEMKKSKMKRLKKLEYAFNHGCNIQVLEPVYRYSEEDRKRKAIDWEWRTVHTADYIKIAFVRNLWLRIVPKSEIAYCDIVETR